MEDLEPNSFEHWYAFSCLIKILTNKAFSWHVKPRENKVIVHIHGGKHGTRL